ncbi:hypothetical protein HAX54_016768 [Datura stramonium]|uniref:Uncharacterized protein n=1 Tax=Datura stramonium TaxID=4076 RepID=A0ABS8UJH1_DATST|nr:hypothetical protein [Datura stramonium]
MADPELEAIRQRRMQELMAKQGMVNNRLCIYASVFELCYTLSSFQLHNLFTNNSFRQIGTQQTLDQQKAQDEAKRFLSYRSFVQNVFIISNISSCFQHLISTIEAIDVGRRMSEGKQMLTQILTSEARARVARIALVKPDKARGVEDVILRAAQYGQITEKVSEQKLIELLVKYNTCKLIQRRRNVLEDDD